MAWIPDVSRTLVTIKRLERREDLLENCIKLFQSFFDDMYSPSEFVKRMELLDRLRSESEGRFIDPEIEAAEETAIRDPVAGVELVVDRLHGLAPLFDAPNGPDGPMQTPMVAAGIHYHAALLVRAMRQSGIAEQQYGFGDDVRPAFHALEKLWHRYGDADSVTLLTIRSLFCRVGSELEVQSGNYAVALRELALSLKAFVQSDDQSSRMDPYLVLPWEDRCKLPQWLEGIEDRAKSYVEMLRNVPEGEVDWESVIDSCQTLKSYLPDDEPTTRRGTDDANVEETEYWDETIGWAKAQLTPSQIRSLIERSENQAAKFRLSHYFFDGGKWYRLSESGQNALILCDILWMDDGPESRLSQILSPLQRATENTLYNHLWRPFVQWTRTKPEFFEYPERLLAESGKQHPGLTEYIKTLLSIQGKSYLRTLGLGRKDLRYLSKRIPTLLRYLRHNRNKVEHEPSACVDLNEVRDIYRAYLGIGRRGVIPEIVRLLGGVSGQTATLT